MRKRKRKGGRGGGGDGGDGVNGDGERERKRVIGREEGEWGVRKADSGGSWGRDGDWKPAVLGRRRDM